jgi:hypothetical protein
MARDALAEIRNAERALTIVDEAAPDPERVHTSARYARPSSRLNG